MKEQNRFLGQEPPTVCFDGRYYLPGALLHEGEESRVFAAQPEGAGGGNPAFVIKQYRCVTDSDGWRCAHREIEVMKQLRHCRHTVQLLASAERAWNGAPGGREICLLTERMTPCEKWFAERTDEAEVLRLCREIAAALRCMNRRGLTHGDVKPSNLFRHPRRGWQLGDFGSVMERGERPKYVSEGYCSPRARRGEPCGLEDDLYALGVTAYKLLSGGRLPFCDRPCAEMPEEEVYAAISRRLSGEPIPPIENVTSAANRTVSRLMGNLSFRNAVFY